MPTNPTKVTFLENDQQLRDLVSDFENAVVDAEGFKNTAQTEASNAADEASDAQKHAQATSSFTDSDGNDFDKGAKGYAQQVDSALTGKVVGIGAQNARPESLSDDFGIYVDTDNRVLVYWIKDEWYIGRDEASEVLGTDIGELPTFETYFPPLLHRYEFDTGSGSMVEDKVGSKDIPLSGTYSWESEGLRITDNAITVPNIAFNGLPACFVVTMEVHTLPDADYNYVLFIKHDGSTSGPGIRYDSVYPYSWVMDGGFPWFNYDSDNAYSSYPVSKDFDSAPFVVKAGVFVNEFGLQGVIFDRLLLTKTPNVDYTAPFDVILSSNSNGEITLRDLKIYEGNKINFWRDELQDAKDKYVDYDAPTYSIESEGKEIINDAAGVSVANWPMWNTPRIFSKVINGDEIAVNGSVLTGGAFSLPVQQNGGEWKVRVLTEVPNIRPFKGSGNYHNGNAVIIDDQNYVWMNYNFHNDPFTVARTSKPLNTWEGGMETYEQPLGSNDDKSTYAFWFLDNNDRPNIVYRNFSNTVMATISQSNPAQFEPFFDDGTLEFVTSSIRNYHLYRPIRMDSDGWVHFAMVFREESNTNRDLTYFKVRRDGTVQWADGTTRTVPVTKSDLETVAMPLDDTVSNSNLGGIALDSNNNPIITYDYGGPRRAYWDGSSWSKVDLPTSLPFPTIVTGPNDKGYLIDINVTDTDWTLSYWESAGPPYNTWSETIMTQGELDVPVYRPFFPALDFQKWERDQTFRMALSVTGSQTTTQQEKAAPGVVREILYDPEQDQLLT